MAKQIKSYKNKKSKLTRAMSVMLTAVMATGTVTALPFTANAATGDNYSVSAQAESDEASAQAESDEVSAQAESAEVSAQAESAEVSEQTETEGESAEGDSSFVAPEGAVFTTKYAYDCQRTPAFPTAAGKTVNLSSFKNPYAGTETEEGPWSMVYVGTLEDIADDPEYSYMKSELQDYKNYVSDADINTIPIYNLYQGDKKVTDTRANRQYFFIYGSFEDSYLACSSYDTGYYFSQNLYASNQSISLEIKSTTDIPEDVVRHTVTFELDGGTPVGSANYSDKIVVDGAKVKLPIGPEKDGYKFVGWEHDGAVLEVGSELKVTADISLTAKYKVVYNVTFDLNDGSPASGADYSEKGVVDGNKIILPIGSEKKYYDFVNWKSGDKTYNAGEEVEVTSDMTFAAQYEVPDSDKLIISFQYNEYVKPDSTTFEWSDNHTVEHKEFLPQLENDDAGISLEELKAIIQDNAFILKSNYFDYTLDLDSMADVEVLQTRAGKIVGAIARFKETPHVYSAEVNVGGHTEKVSGYYQQPVFLNASNYGLGDNANWYRIDEQGNETLVATGASYKFRLYADDSTIVARAGSASLDGKTMTVDTYYDFSLTDSGTRQITQNFYVQDFLAGDKAYDADGNEVANATNIQYLGSGVMYYITKPDGSLAKPAAQTYIDNMQSFIESKLNGNYSTAIAATQSSGLAYAYTPYQEGTKQNYSTSLNAYLHNEQITFKVDNNRDGYKVNFVSYFTYSYEVDGVTYYAVKVADTTVQANVYEERA